MAAVEHVTSPPIPWRWSARGLWRLLKLLAGALVSAVDYLSLNSNERRSRAGLARWLQRTCVRALAALRIEVRMPESFPAGVMLAPNHVSYLDILVISALSPTVFVAKAEVEGWPLFGWFARRAGMIAARLDGVEGLRVHVPQAGMFALLDVRAHGLSGEAFGLRLLEDSGVACMPGESFGIAAAGHIRIAMTIDDDRFGRALQLICDFARDLSRS